MKTIKAVARYTQLKNTETKRAFVLNESWNSFAATGSYFYNYNFLNIFSILGTGAQGTGQNQFVGDQVLDPLMVARIQFYVDWNTFSPAGATTLEPVMLHTWIIAANDQYAAAAPTNVNVYSTILDWFLQTRPSRAVMNGDSCKVLHHWTRTVTPPSVPTAVSAAFPNLFSTACIRKKIVHKFKGKKTFEPQNPTSPNLPGAYLKGWNYYLICGWGLPDGTFNLNVPTGASTRPVTIYLDRYLYFKDP